MALVSCRSKAVRLESSIFDALFSQLEVLTTLFDTLKFQNVDHDPLIFRLL